MVYGNLRTAASHMAMIADRWVWPSRNNSRRNTLSAKGTTS